jgi:transcriptional regulator with XRE-family HTH domain
MTGQYTPRQRDAFVARLAAALDDSDLTQGELADAIGIGAENRSQISQWRNGKNGPPAPPRVFQLERELGLPAGELSQTLGYLPTGEEVPECNTETAIATDPRLDERTRTALLALLEQYVSWGEE